MVVRVRGFASSLVGCAALAFSHGTAQAAAYCASDASASPVLMRGIEARLGPSPLDDVGPAARSLAGEVQRQLCSDPSVSTLLPSTCAAPSATGSELRARLVVDLLNVPNAALRERMAQSTPEQRMVVSYLSALTGGLEPHEVAHRAAMSLGLASAECSAPGFSADDPASVAIGLVWVITDPATNPVGRTQPETEALIRQVLTTVRGGAGLAPEQEALVAPLAVQATQTFAWYTEWQKSPGDPQALRQLLLAEFTLLQNALALASARSVVLPEEAWALVVAVLEARVDGAIAVLRGWLVARAELEGNVLDHAETVLGLTRARTEEEVRALLLGYDELWPDGLLLSASAGVPVLQSDNFNIVGEGMLGYNADAWGLVGGGGASVLEFESPEYLATTVKLFGNGDGWLSFELGEGTLLDARATFDFTMFDSETVVVEDAILSAEETSLLLRGGGLVGVRHQGTAAAVGVWAGGGGQLEWYDRRATIVDDTGTPTQLSDLASGSGMFQGRLRLQWSVAPDTLALRVAADAKYYQMARMSSAIDATSAGDATVVETDEEAIQLEALGRAFVDLEVARLFEFVPGVGVGVDHYQLAITGQETQVTTIPIYFLGVRRTAF